MHSRNEVVDGLSKSNLSEYVKFSNSWIAQEVNQKRKCVRPKSVVKIYRGSTGVLSGQPMAGKWSLVH
jgi:hypothetical protein